jgi:hypothetical protein
LPDNASTAQQCREDGWVKPLDGASSSLGRQWRESASTSCLIPKLSTALLSSKFEQAAAQYVLQDGGGAGDRDSAAGTLSYQQIGSYEVAFVEGCVQVDEQQQQQQQQQQPSTKRARHALDTLAPVPACHVRTAIPRASEREREKASATATVAGGHQYVPDSVPMRLARGPQRAAHQAWLQRQVRGQVPRVQRLRDCVSACGTCGCGRSALRRLL